MASQLRARFTFDPWRVGAAIRDDARRTVEKLNAEDHAAKRVARREFSHAPREKIDNGEEISAKCEARDEDARQFLVAPPP
jgi:hypothetical protein